MDKKEHLDRKNKHVIDYDEDEKKKHVIDDDEYEKKKKVDAKGATSILEGVSLSHIYGIKPHHLQNELVEKILPLLDVKSLLRFQLVSKDWMSMIRKPELTMQHKEMKPNPNYLFLLTSASEARPEICFTRIEVHPYRKRAKQEIILNVSHHITEREIPNHREYSLPNASVTFRSQAVNGLVCTFGSNGQVYKVFILNPYTRILLTLPDGPPQRPHLQSPSHFHNQIAFHFGFDPNREEYKVLQAQWALEGATASDSVFPGEVLEFKLCIITLGSTEWRLIEPPLFLTANEAYDFLDNTNKSLFVRRSGSMYWLYFYSILAFDVGLETFSLIQVPQSFSYPWCISSEFSLVEVEESLALIWKDKRGQPRLSIRRHDSWETREEDLISCWKSNFHKTLFPISPSLIMATERYPRRIRKFVGLELLDVPTKTTRMYELKIKAPLRCTPQQFVEAQKQRKHIEVPFPHACSIVHYEESFMIPQAAAGPATPAAPAAAPAAPAAGPATPAAPPAAAPAAPATPAAPAAPPAPPAG